MSAPGPVKVMGYGIYSAAAGDIDDEDLGDGVVEGDPPAQQEEQ